MPDGAGYDQDFFLWARHQAELLRDGPREGRNAAIDWENVAEEIESLSRRERQRLESFLETTLEHLLKLALLPALPPREGWESTVSRCRRDIQRILKDSPSLRSTVPGIVEDLSADVRLDVARTLSSYGEHAAAATVRLGHRHPEIEDRVLDKSFFPAPEQPVTEG